MTITFTTGLMGSGKSKKLIDQFKKDPSSCIAFSTKIDGDTGTLGIIKSRSGEFIFGINLNANQKDEVISIIKLFFSKPGLDTVYIDEVQFFDKLTISKIMNLSLHSDINLHLFGLSTTFTGEPFESSDFLLNSGELKQIIKLPMTCQYEGCNLEAEYNARIVDGKVVRTGKTFVEEKSMYLAYCKKHYFS